MIRFEAASKVYNAGRSLVTAVDQITFDVPQGCVCILLGPSGCGKTTLLRMVNRLIPASSGRILLGGEDISSLDPIVLRRRIGYVIQQIGLFPNMTIEENVAVVPNLLGWSAEQKRRRFAELMDLVGLDPQKYARRYPKELSGGQQQRVGVARAMAADPPVLLMDEPFGALDPITRERLQNEFLEIQSRVRKTILFVSHDIQEALKLGDFIAILRDGKLVQYGTPAELVATPTNEFVAEFIGSDRALKYLDLLPASAAIDPAQAEVSSTPGGSPTLRAGSSLKDVLLALLSSHSGVVALVDDQGRPAGQLTLESVTRVVRESPLGSGAEGAA